MTLTSQVHWGQGIRKNPFQMYDYGSKGANTRAYGRGTPPPYNLTAIQVPIVLYAGAEDYLADPTGERRVTGKPSCRVTMHTYCIVLESFEK